MNTNPSTPSFRASHTTATSLFVLGVLVRSFFLHLHPIVYGGDSVMRMMNADRVLIAYQLPFLQLLIFGANLLSEDPVVLRYLVVVLGGFAGVGFYWLSSVLWGREIGLPCALFFICNPFILVHSLVPYQEILMLLMLCVGLALLFEDEARHRLGLASLCLGLACLTRYEAWVVVLAAAGFYWRMRAKEISPFRWITTLKLVWFFGWVPILWIGLQRGLSPSGTFVLEGVREAERLYRPLYALLMAIYHAGPLVGLLAVMGSIELWQGKRWRDARIQTLILATLLLLGALVFSAHGVPPNPLRYVTDREAHWLMLPLFWVAGLGIYWIKRRWLLPERQPVSGLSRGRTALGRTAYYGLICVCLVWGLYETQRRLVRLTSEADLQLDFQVAKYLDEHLRQGANVLILSKPVASEAVDDYLEKARQKGGEVGKAAALRVLTALDTGPFDYSRTIVNSHLGKSRFFQPAQLKDSASGDLAQRLRALQVRVVVWFANYSPSSPWESQLTALVQRRGKKSIELNPAGQSASVFEMPD